MNLNNISRFFKNDERESYNEDNRNCSSTMFPDDVEIATRLQSTIRKERDENAKIRNRFSGKISLPTATLPSMPSPPNTAQKLRQTTLPKNFAYSPLENTAAQPSLLPPPNKAQISRQKTLPNNFTFSPRKENLEMFDVMMHTTEQKMDVNTTRSPPQGHLLDRQMSTAYYNNIMREDEEHRLIDDDAAGSYLPEGMSLPSGVDESSLSDEASLETFSMEISSSWTSGSTSSTRRMVQNFIYARNRRKEIYGSHAPLGLYLLHCFLNEIRSDVDWAKDTAKRIEQNKSFLSWSEWDRDKNTPCTVVKRPYFFVTLILTCVVQFFVSLYGNGWKIESMRTNPMIGPSAETLLKLGAKKTSLVLDGEWWRIFTASLLHAGIIHSLVNMSILWILANQLEPHYGFVNVTLLFVLPDIFGTILSCVFLPEHESVGASGGVCGLVGALLADIVTNWNLLFNQRVVMDDVSVLRNILVIVFLVLCICLNLAFGLIPMIDNFSHIGGIFLGFFFGLSLGRHVSRNLFGVEKGLLKHICDIFVRLFGLVVSVIAYTAAIYALLNSEGKDLCPKCKYMSCVPTKWWKCPSA